MRFDVRKYDSESLLTHTKCMCCRIHHECSITEDLYGVLLLPS